MPFSRFTAAAWWRPLAVAAACLAAGSSAALAQAGPAGPAPDAGLPPNRTTATATATAGASVPMASTAHASPTGQPPQAGPVAPAALSALRRLFDTAWQQQPEAQALPARRDAARAQQRAAQAWTPEPPALLLGGKTDGPGRQPGTRELEAGVALPLWLPGERGRQAALADAEGRAVDSRASAAQLQVAAQVREAWWAWQRARAEQAAARAQLAQVRRLAADVAQRLKAGELARADQHQADGAVAAAEAVLAQAEAGSIAAWQPLRAWAAGGGVVGGAGDAVAGAALATAGAMNGTGVGTGTAAGPLVDAAPWLADLQPEPEPPPSPPTSSPPPAEAHAELQALADRAVVAERSLALAASQSRAHPELTLSTTRERGAAGEPYQQTLTLGLRIPFGGGPRQDARLAAARADAAELQAQQRLALARLAGEREAARARTDAARAQLAAAERRAELARTTRGFFDKSFRLGETDLPTRLRIEAEAAEAERQAGRARIELAAAVSAWRQALGLLPL